MVAVVAPVELHVSVALAFGATVVEFAAKVTVGAEWVVAEVPLPHPTIIDRNRKQISKIKRKRIARIERSP
jgi:hypothetical protein